MTFKVRGLNSDSETNDFMQVVCNVQNNVLTDLAQQLKAGAA